MVDPRAVHGLSLTASSPCGGKQGSAPGLVPLQAAASWVTLMLMSTRPSGAAPLLPTGLHQGFLGKDGQALAGAGSSGSDRTGSRIIFQRSQQSDAPEQSRSIRNVESCSCLPQVQRTAARGEEQGPWQRRLCQTLPKGSCCRGQELIPAAPCRQQPLPGPGVPGAARGRGGAGLQLPLSPGGTRSDGGLRHGRARGLGTLAAI